MQLRTKSLSFKKRLINQRYLILLSIPFIAWQIIFRYVPQND